ncbi:Beta-glucosidase [Bertholletia excelsa]
MVLLVVVPLLLTSTMCVAEYGQDVSPKTINFDTRGLNRESFPKGFIFGIATSAYQVEGMVDKDNCGSKTGKGDTPMHGNGELRGLPLHVTTRSSITIARGNEEGVAEDIDLMAKLNFDAYRISISWSRIFPNGTGEANEKGVAYYNILINDMLKRGITPYANLNHYDLPQALQERYLGWLSHNVVKDFADYADFCFKTFGDRVKNWFTFNEPRVVAALGYDNGLNATGRSHNLILSHGAAVQRYRQKFQEKQKGRIGIILDFSWYEPLTKSKADNYAAHRARDLTVTACPKYLGYQQDWNTSFAFSKRGVPIGPWAYSYWLYIVPWGLYKAVSYIKERYGNPPIILSENGMDDPGNVTLPKGLHDTKRINYYKAYLNQLKRAIDDGASVTGYFAWSLLDNFEWGLGYTSRFGIVFVDCKTLKRYPKMSAYWFRQLLRRNNH